MQSIEKANVFLYGELIGFLSRDTVGFHFTYLDDYQGLPLSLSLPVASKAFHSTQLFPYFLSLIPEGWLKKRYSELQKIDDTDLFGLLVNNGENMIGAVQIRRENAIL